MPTSASAGNRVRAHPTAVFYGDSLVTGWRGTTRPEARWSDLVCERLGWREVPLAVDGMGYLRRRGPRDAQGQRPPSTTDTTLLDAAIRLAPDVVVVCLGINDVVLVDERPDDVHAGIRRDLSRLPGELPGVPVVVTMYAPSEELSAAASLVEGWVVDECVRSGLRYVQRFGRAVGGDPDLLCDDGFHPNDAGHAALAEAILPTLRELGI
ncbi:MAG TPA: SGNH/GDSL hydrolase family protein [Marmoricola sp.]|nr:SGNH/GDSL hydrolase family protein [Marmoricola sp.]